MKTSFGKTLIGLAVLGLAFALSGCPISTSRTHNPGNPAGPPPWWDHPGDPVLPPGQGTGIVGTWERTLEQPHGATAIGRLVFEQGGRAAHYHVTSVMGMENAVPILEGTWSQINPNTISWTANVTPSISTQISFTITGGGNTLTFTYGPFPGTFTRR